MCGPDAWTGAHTFELGTWLQTFCHLPLQHRWRRRPYWCTQLHHSGVVLYVDALLLQLSKLNFSNKHKLAWCCWTQIMRKKMDSVNIDLQKTSVISALREVAIGHKTSRRRNTMKSRKIYKMTTIMLPSLHAWSLAQFSDLRSDWEWDLCGACSTHGVRLSVQLLTWSLWGLEVNTIFFRLALYPTQLYSFQKSISKQSISSKMCDCLGFCMLGLNLSDLDQTLLFSVNMSSLRSWWRSFVCNRLLMMFLLVSLLLVGKLSAAIQAACLARYLAIGLHFLYLGSSVGWTCSNTSL